jgi:hypothetical protein
LRTPTLDRVRDYMGAAGWRVVLGGAEKAIWALNGRSVGVRNGDHVYDVLRRIAPAHGLTVAEITADIRRRTGGTL